MKVSDRSGGCASRRWPKPSGEDPSTHHDERLLQFKEKEASIGSFAGPGLRGESILGGVQHGSSD